MIPKPYILIWTMLLSLVLHAVSGTKPSGGGNSSRLFGKVIDAKTRKPLDYATISVFLNTKDSLLSGMLTESKGEFSLEHLPTGTFRVKVSFVGCKDFVKQVTLTAANPEQDMGNISMESSAAVIEGVEIKAEKATMTMNIDRKVFNVDKDISSRGGSAIDVMKNIPGVSVDGDGNITLRNNSPQIYVDGKPTSLTLDLIPSDQIDYIETITNPSAKYEAASSGGIINVVLKHDRRPGYNAMVSLLGGTNSQYNGTGLINFHKDKWGFSFSFNTSGQRNTPHTYNNRINLDHETHVVKDYYDQDLVRVNKRAFQTIRTGIDYFVSNRNTLSLTENMVIGRFSNDIDADIRNLDANAQLVSHGLNYSYEGVDRRTFTTNADFKHTYPRQGKEYNISLSYERYYSQTDFFDSSNTYSPAGALLSGTDGIFKQRIPSGIRANQLTAQWDFSMPIRDSLKLEFGIRSYYKRSSSFANVSDYSVGTATWHPNALVSTDYLTNELINAAYISISHQIRKFSYQVGLRFEQVYFSGDLRDKGQFFSYQYPSSAGAFYESFFPSFYLSQRVNDHHIFQLNMTRKTNRPSGGQINPNLEVLDKYDYTVGNPALKPEFVNQGEMNYNMAYGKIDWLSSIYGRYTEHPIMSYTYLDTTLGANSLLQTYLNAQARFNYGWENTFKIMPTKNLSLMLNANLYYVSIRSQAIPGVNGEEVNAGYSMTAKAMVSYKFPLGFAAQINGAYEAPKPVTQGRASEVYFFDISASKDFGIATVSFTLSDVLNSRANAYQNFTPDYIQSTVKRREVRYAKLSVVFKFGKEDTQRKAKKAKKEKDEEGGE